MASQMSANVAAATLELEAMSDTFNRLSQQCFRKCIGKYKEPELSSSETVCIDRCVVKYMEVIKTVSARMSAAQTPQ